MNNTLTLPAPILSEKIGVMRPAATGPTFGAWATIYSAPIVYAPIVHDREFLGMSAADMDFTGLEF